jgi:hypothetical protein
MEVAPHAGMKKPPRDTREPRTRTLDREQLAAVRGANEKTTWKTGGSVTSQDSWHSTP